jgi:hypothetical protein
MYKSRRRTVSVIRVPNSSKNGTRITRIPLETQIFTDLFLKLHIAKKT